MATENLNIVITASGKEAVASVNSVTASLEKMTAAANASTAATTRTAAGSTAAVNKWGKAVQARSAAIGNATRRMTLPLAFAGAAAGKLAYDYQVTFDQISNLTEASQKDMDRWAKRILVLAPKLGKAPNELAQALYFVASSGIPAAKAMDVVVASTKAAAIGMGDADVIARALTAVLNAYRGTGINASEATNTLAEAVKLGSAEADSYATSLGRVIPFAAQMGVEFDEVSAALSSMTLTGLSAAEATTALRNIFIPILKPTEDAKDLFEQWGTSAQELQNDLSHDFLGTMQELAAHFKGNATAASEVFDNVRGLVGAFSLTGKNADHVSKIFEKLSTHEQAVQRGFKDLQDKSFAQQLRQVWAQIEVWGTELGTSLMKDLVPAFEHVQDVLNSKELTGEQKFEVLLNDLTRVVEDAAPKIAEVGGKIAAALAKGFVSAFTNSDIIGKLFLGGALLRIIGGRGIFLKAGIAMAGWLFAGFGKAAAGGEAVAVASTGLKAGLLTMVKRAGLVGIGLTLADGIFGSIEDRAQEAGRDITEALHAYASTSPFEGAIGAIGNAAGVDLGIQDEADIGKHLEDTYNHILKDKIAISEETRAQVMAEADSLGVNESVKASLKQQLDLAVQRTHQMEQFQDIGVDVTISDPLPQKRVDLIMGRIAQMRRGLFNSLKDINQVTRQASAAIRGSNLPDKAKRSTLVETFKAQVKAIEKLDDRNVISHRKAINRIEKINHKADLIGGLHLNKLSHEWSKTFNHLPKITDGSMKEVIAEMKKLPPAAQGEAWNAIKGQLKQYVKGNKMTKDEFRDIRSGVLSELDHMKTGGVLSSFNLFQGFGKNIGALGSAVSSGLGWLTEEANKVFKQLKVDLLDYSAKKAPKQQGGGQRRARGGEIYGSYVGGSGDGDKVPAMLEPGEVVLNKKAVSALGGARRANKINRAIPRYATGGVIEQALGPYTIPPIMYDPNHAGSNSHIHADFFTKQQAITYGHKMQGMGWTISEYTGNVPGFGPVTVHHESPGHYDGTAFDANSADESRAAVAAVAKLFNSGVAMGAMAREIGRVVLKGPDNGFRESGQKVLDQAREAINKKIQRNSTDMGVSGYVTGGDGAVAAQMGRILLKTGWNRTGAAGVIGNAYRESLWNPAAVGTGGGGLFGFTTSPVSLADLQAFAKQSHKPWTDVALQMQFMQNHLPASVKSATMNAGSPEAAAERFMTLWERPGIPALDERQAAARRAFEMNTWAKGGIIKRLAKGTLDGTGYPYTGNINYTGTGGHDGGGRSGEALRDLLSRRGKGIESLQDLIAAIETRHAWATSEAGEEMGPKERLKQIQLNKRLLKRMVTQAGDLSQLQGRLADRIKFLNKKIENRRASEDKLDDIRKKLEHFKKEPNDESKSERKKRLDKVEELQKQLKNKTEALQDKKSADKLKKLRSGAKEELADVRSQLDDLLGTSRKNGLILGVRDRLHALRATDTTSEDELTRLQDLNETYRSQLEALQRNSYLGWYDRNVFSGFASELGLPFVGAFAKGTPYVQQTGMALVHQGEAIIPAGQNGPITIVFQGDIGSFVDAKVNGAMATIDKQLGSRSRKLRVAPGRA